MEMVKQHGGGLLRAVMPLSVGNGQKESGGLDFSKPPLIGVLIGLLYDGFFSFAVVRQSWCYLMVFLCNDTSILNSHNTISHLCDLRVMGNHYNSLVKFFACHF